jgi:hypothetical protein
LYQCLQDNKTLEKSSSLFQERDPFSHDAAMTEIIAQFLKGTTKTCCCLDGSKAVQRRVSLFNASMILLQTSIEVFVRPMLDLVTHCLADSPGGGTMSIGCDRLWSMTNHSNSLFEELFCRVHISLFTQPRIHEIAIRVNGPIEITPLSMDSHGGFIDLPGSSCLTVSFGP